MDFAFLIKRENAKSYLGNGYAALLCHHWDLRFMMNTNKEDLFQIGWILNKYIYNVWHFPE